MAAMTEIAFLFLKTEYFSLMYSGSDGLREAGTGSNQFPVSSNFVGDHVSAMLAYWDKDLICRFANAAYVDWFGVSPGEMIGKLRIDQLLGPQLYEMNRPYIEGVLRGDKQVFERTLITASGGVRSVFATYYPDLRNEVVQGFFVHVADVTPLKELEAKVRSLEEDRRKAILQSVIETREQEREAIAVELQDSINQTLASASVRLQNENPAPSDAVQLADIATRIREAIHQLNQISNHLSPVLVRDFGCRTGLGEYATNYQNEFGHRVRILSGGTDPDELAYRDQLSVFRIVQEFLWLLRWTQPITQFVIGIDIAADSIVVALQCEGLLRPLPKDSREFRDISNLVDFHDGTLRESCSQQPAVVKLEIVLPKKAAGIP